MFFVTSLGSPLQSEATASSLLLFLDDMTLHTYALLDVMAFEEDVLVSNCTRSAVVHTHASGSAELFPS